MGGVADDWAAIAEGYIGARKRQASVSIPMSRIEILLLFAKPGPLAQSFTGIDLAGLVML
jgi:hypothetical protein